MSWDIEKMPIISFWSLRWSRNWLINWLKSEDINGCFKNQCPTFLRTENANVLILSLNNFLTTNDYEWWLTMNKILKIAKVAKLLDQGKISDLLVQELRIGIWDSVVCGHMTPKWVQPPIHYSLSLILNLFQFNHQWYKWLISKAVCMDLVNQWWFVCISLLTSPGTCSSVFVRWLDVHQVLGHCRLRVSNGLISLSKCFNSAS